METKIIGNKIAKARKEKNISQAQLAEHLFISPQAVGKWERGESMPDIVTLNRLAEVLGVDLNYFSENFAPATQGTSVPDPSVKQPIELPSENQKEKLNWDMSKGNWVDADFSGLKNLHDKLSSSNMQNCTFIGSDMSGIRLSSNNIDRCDFSGSDISNSRIQNSRLINDVFESCSMKGAEISGSAIKNCNFSGADFNGTTFKSSGFLKNTMAGAVLKSTAFNAMQIADTVFEGTLEDCSFENCAFAGVVFQNATLINTFFKGKSLKRIQFADCKVDKITYAFLKSGKANMTGITLLSSVTTAVNSPTG